MVIVETCIDAGVLHLFFKVFRAVESVNVRWIEDCAANREVHVRSPEVAFQDSRDRTGKARVTSRIFRMIGGGAQGRPGRVGNRGGIPVYTAVRNSRHRAPETEVVLRVPAADERVGSGGPHHGKQVRGGGGVERASHS